LKESILGAGQVFDAVTIDATTGLQLDGFERCELVAELRAEKYKIEEPLHDVRNFADDSQRLVFVLSTFAGRQMTAVVRKEILRASLLRVPEWSDRRLAELVGMGVDHKTVAVVRRELERCGEIPRTGHRLDASGRRQPVSRSRITGVTAREVPQARETLARLGTDAPPRGMDLRQAGKHLRRRNWERYGPDNTRPVPTMSAGGSWMVACDDFRSALKDLKNESVDLVVADLPWDASYEFCLDICQGVFPVMRDGAAVVLICSERRFSNPTSAALAAGIEDVLSGYIRFTGRPARRAGQLVVATPFLIFSKGVLHPTSELHQELHYPSGWHTETEHPYEKPPEVLGHWVARLSAPGGLVLDPCCGSGSTGVAALGAGRRFVGCDIKPECAEIATQRLEAAEASLPAEVRETL
jgi:hypothetical protein